MAFPCELKKAMLKVINFAKYIIFTGSETCYKSTFWFWYIPLRVLILETLANHDGKGNEDVAKWKNLLGRIIAQHMRFETLSIFF